jgi:hypothetical protein
MNNSHFGDTVVDLDVVHLVRFVSYSITETAENLAIRYRTTGCCRIN